MCPRIKYAHSNEFKFWLIWFFDTSSHCSPWSSGYVTVEKPLNRVTHVLVIIVTQTLHWRKCAQCAKHRSYSSISGLITCRSLPIMSEAQQAALRNFRWASGVTDDSRTSNNAAGQSSVWSRWTSFAGSYIPLRSDERTNEEEAYFALSRWERCDYGFFSLLYRAELLAWEKRLLGFGACLLGAVACFFVAFISLSLRPSKFALAFRCVFLPWYCMVECLHAAVVWDLYSWCLGMTCWRKSQSSPWRESYSDFLY